MGIEEGSQPHAHPKVEIYCVEVATGLAESDAREVAGLDWAMLIEPGEKVPHKRSRVQIQTLRRINARLEVLDAIDNGLDPIKYQEFIARNRRAHAEIRWVKMIIEAGGVEPDLDQHGKPVRKKSNVKQIESQAENGTAAQGETI